MPHPKFADRRRAEASRRIIVATLATTALAFGHPAAMRAQTFVSPTSSPSPVVAPATSPADPIAVRAREWLGRLQANPPAIDRSQLTPALSQAYDDVTIAAMARQVANFGAPKRFEPLRTFTMPGGSTAHVYRVTWDTGSLDFLFALDGNGKISAMYFRPAK